PSPGAVLTTILAKLLALLQPNRIGCSRFCPPNEISFFDIKSHTPTPCRSTVSSPTVPSTAKPRSRYRLAILLALVVAAGAVGGTVWWSSRRGDAERQAALQAARSGDFATAEPLLKAALEHQPNDAE